MPSQIRLEMTRIVSVEQRSDKAAVEIRRSEEPVGDWERQVHVRFHHQSRVVMSGMVAAQRIDEGAVAHEPILINVAAEVHELIDKIHARGHAHEQPTDIG